MEELLKEISAKLDAIKGFLVLAATPAPIEEKIISTPFGMYRVNKEGKKEKVELVDGKWVVVAPESGMTTPATEYLPAYNLYPWPGVEYTGPASCPVGQHIEYDYNNNTRVCLNNCGPIGTK
ncbi:MAG: hypothetical protein PHF12_05215 [Candidatus Omnitrophica bacterium]|jgi:hypothetical protein|nr:hypothetical protein [Candidatus Omnitrophota bacterium]